MVTEVNHLDIIPFKLNRIGFDHRDQPKVVIVEDNALHTILIKKKLEELKIGKEIEWCQDG